MILECRIAFLKNNFCIGARPQAFTRNPPHGIYGICHPILTLLRMHNQPPSSTLPRTNCFLNSLFLRPGIEWNGLPRDIIVGANRDYCKHSLNLLALNAVLFSVLYPICFCIFYPYLYATPAIEQNGLPSPRFFDLL